MRIHRLTAFHVPIALRRPVRHASHERTSNDTLIVRCVLDDGSVGWGEGLPRTYVTGESIDSAWRQLEQTRFESLREARFDSPAAAAAAVEALVLADVPADPHVIARECFGNAVRCALELAILDAACRSAGVSLGSLIGQLPQSAAFADCRDQVFYSGAITSESPRKQWLSAMKMRLFGFRQIKVKVGTKGITDAACLRRIRLVVGQAVDLRLDANEAWHCEELESRMAPLLPFRPSCLEQPVPHRDVAGLAAVRQRLSVPIMLDESLCCRADAERAIAGAWCDAFNIRLSKCGGLVRSLELVQLARQHGVFCQLGCQVGETGILSAAGRHFACHVPNLRYVEGSFDRFLVRDTLVEPDITFGYGGRGRRLTEAGLGVTVNECRVRDLTLRTLELLAQNRS
ncbi:MAG: mandelate racemase/muconate lactonizing enzyme family protein [Planctomycetota bacterium]